MSKMDLITTSDDDSGHGRNGLRGRKNIARYLDSDSSQVRNAEDYIHRYLEADTSILTTGETSTNRRFHALNQAIVQLVSFLDDEHSFR
jgi:GPN-loop GTPase